jgi:hypothetical protein
VAKPCIVTVCATILDVALGQWCQSCLLPSGYLLTVATEYPSGTPWEVLALSGCGACLKQEPL